MLDTQETNEQISHGILAYHPILWSVYLQTIDKLTLIPLFHVHSSPTHSLMMALYY